MKDYGSQEKSCEYPSRFIHFYDSSPPFELLALANNLAERVGKKSLKVIDIGCGDGNFLFWISKVFNERDIKIKELFGLDYSKIRLKRANLNSKAHLLKANADDIVNIFPEDYFDVVINNQVIEHIKDDIGFLKKVSKILKKNGIALISSVIRHKDSNLAALLLRIKNTPSALDPTHYREYSSVEEFSNLIRKAGLSIIKIITKPVKNSPFSWLIRNLLHHNVIYFNNPNRFFYNHAVPDFFRNSIQLRIPGYKEIFTICKKDENAFE